MARKVVVCLCLALFTLCAVQGARAYDFPIEDRYAATIIGTPSEFKADLSGKVRMKEREITIFPDRKVPDYLWYAQTMPYLLADHYEKEAPLVFAIAGTGGSHKTSKLVALLKTLYLAGFHVVTLPSPTYADFVVSASTSGIPGQPVDDAKDLYRAMKLIWEDIKDDVRVSEFYLTGYSLGGLNSAFIAKLDEEEGVFDFKKVLIINPPVSLYTSVSILDNMGTDSIPGGPNGFSEFFDDAMDRLAKVYKDADNVQFAEDFLYSAYRHGNETGEFTQEERDRHFKAIIGVSFRISSANMIISSDLMTNRGFIIPKDSEVRATDSLTVYGKVAGRTTFVNYFDEYFIPYFKERQSGVTRDALIQEMSLKSIQPYLSTRTKIGLLTNADDIILGPGDLDFLRQVFGDRATIYPLGGHCGNMDHKAVVDHMVGFFRN